MNKNLVAAVMAIGIGLIILGLLGVNLGGLEVCIEPYILSEGFCCLDSDQNLVCDKHQDFGSGWRGLNATISYKGTRFTVTNNDTFSWDNCMAEVDGKWIYKCGTINPGKTFVFDHGDLKGDHGERMPYDIRAGNLTIHSAQGTAYKSFQ
ncbi:MAG: hypothetical protein V1703_03480 [Candidatus Altiarchaeota archaeon]